MTRKRLFILCLSCCVLSTGCGKEKPGLSIRNATVTIGGYTWNVAIAITEEELYRGLSGRSNLAPDEGMLFIYQEPEIRTFCMRQCDHPLDIIFIGFDMRVINTCEMKVEPSRKGDVLYSSCKPAVWALEVASGTIEKRGISPGDKVIFCGVPLR